MAEIRDTEVLAELLRALADRNYQFVPPTPETHRRVISRRPKREAADLRDVFGWSLPFRDGVLDSEIVALMERAGVLRRQGRRSRSEVRVASLAGRLFLHSAYPPRDEAVFFGPDTYRFVDFLRSELGEGVRARRVLDFGAGSGAGGIVVAHLCRPERLVLADVNPAALCLAEANARFAEVAVESLEADGFQQLEGPFHLIIANPPFIAEGGHTYRNGGGMHGSELSLQWVEGAAGLLAGGGRLLLYTWIAICGGQDSLRDALQGIFGGSDWQLSYREIDPDIFGEELSRPVYRDVERIAAVGIALRRAVAVSERHEALEDAKAFLGLVMAGTSPSGRDLAKG